MKPELSSSTPFEQTANKEDLFVIMPFSATKSCKEEQWTEIFEDVFSPAAAVAGLSCSRAQVGTGSLIKSIVERLKTAYLVLADITDANPNVFYELGVRHSLSTRTIIVAQAASHIPSDLRGYWSLTYGTSPRQVTAFRDAFCGIVKSIRSAPDKSDNPVADYLEREFLQGSRQAVTDIARKLSALHTEFTGIEVALERELLEPRMNSLALHPCLSLLLESRYFDPGDETLQLAYTTRDILRQIADRGFDPKLVLQAKKLLAPLKSKISEIRHKISSGTYVEPEKLSVMEWRTPTEQQSLLTSVAMVCDPGFEDPPSSECISILNPPKK